MTSAPDEPRPAFGSRPWAAAVGPFFRRPLVPVTWPILLLMAVGVGLRWYRLGDQFLLDDEFHALLAAARHPAAELAGRFLFAANSIPVNLYTRWLLDGPGWTEMPLRLPSLVAGFGLLIAAWRFARRRQSLVEGVLIVGLMAVAPLLVYYSRITRPYGLLAWLSFVNTAAAHRLLAEARPAGRARVGPAVAWGLSGGLATWAHQVAAFAVAANGLVLMGRLLWNCGRGKAAVAGREAAIAFGTLVATAAVLVGPAVVKSAGGFSAAYRSSDLYGLQTLRGFFELALGTGRTLPLLACTGALAWGAVRSWQRDRWWLALLAAQAAVCFGALAILRAPDLYSPIVLARYALPLVPLIVVTAAMGWAEAIERLAGRSPGRASGHGRIVPPALAAGLLVCAACLAWGPLPATFARGGNFMHHAAWQETYRHDATRAFGNVHRPSMDVTVETLSPFYASLAGNGSDGPAGIVEFPFPLGHNFCTAAFAQRLHGLPVWGGYVGDPALVDPALDFIRGLATPGTVARAVAAPRRFRLRRFVDLRDAAAVRATGARFLVVHLRPVCEPRGDRPCAGGTDYAETDAAWIGRLADSLAGQLGPPIHADQWLRVFDLRSLTGDLAIPGANATSLRNRALRAADPRASLRLLEQAAACGPDDPRVPLDAGIALLAEEDYPRALAMFTATLEKAAGEPDDLLATAHDGCGVACYHLRRLEDAGRHFRLALELRPGDREIARRIAIVEKALLIPPNPVR